MHVLFQVKGGQSGLTDLKVLLEQVYVKQTSHLQEQRWEKRKRKKGEKKKKKKRAKSLKQVEGNGFSSMISIRVTSVVVGIAHSAHSLKLLCNRQCYPEEMERLLIKCHNYGE